MSLKLYFMKCSETKVSQYTIALIEQSRVCNLNLIYMLTNNKLNLDNKMNNIIIFLLTVKKFLKHPFSKTSGSSFMTWSDYHIIWVNLFKNEPSKICGREPLKNLK